MYTFNYCGSVIAVNVRSIFNFVELLRCFMFSTVFEHLEFQEYLHLHARSNLCMKYCARENQFKQVFEILYGMRSKSGLSGLVGYKFAANLKVKVRNGSQLVL